MVRERIRLLKDEDRQAKTDQTQTQEDSEQPWYKSLPQANMSLPGRLAARTVLGALPINPYVGLADLTSLGANLMIEKINEVQARKKSDKKINFRVPSSRDVIAPLEHLAGLEENPQGIERTFKNIGEYLQLVKGGSLKKVATKAAILTTGEEAAGNLLGEEGRASYKVVAPLVAKGATPIATGRQENGQSTLQVAVQQNPELKQMYDYGRSIGLSDKDLTPILQPNWKSRLLGTFAKKTHGMREQMDKTRKQIGNNYTKLKNEGRTDLVTPVNQNKLFNEVLNLHTEIQNTNILNEDSKSMLNSLEDFMDGMATKPQTVDTLINSYQNINGIPSWKSDADSKRRLLEVNGFIQKAISSKNPRIGKEFAFTNRMYARTKNLAKEVGMRRDPENMFTVGETFGLLSGLGYGAITGDFKKAIPIIGLSASRRIATQLITNPRLQGIHRNILRALESGDKTAYTNALKQLEPILKSEAPKEWKEAKSRRFKVKD